MGFMGGGTCLRMDRNCASGRKQGVIKQVKATGDGR